MSDEKTHGAINTKIFKRLDHVNDQLFEVEMAEAEIEDREPIIVGFFILQYAKLRMLKLYYNFFERFCDVNKFEELKKDTDSLYLPLSEKELCDYIREESKAEWDVMRADDCKDDFSANAKNQLVSLEPSPENIRNMINESLIFSKRSFTVRKYCVYEVKSDVVMTPIPTTTNSPAKV